MTKPSSALQRVGQPEWLLQFGRRLRTARAGAGLTQQQLAAPDLSKSFVSLLESARSYPSVETVVALADRLSSSVASLLLDAPALRLETARNLLHLAWAMNPDQHGADALHLVQSADVLQPDMPAELRVRATLVRARVALAEGRTDDAAGLADEAVEVATRHRPGSALGTALTVKGVIEERRGRYQAAAEILEEALGVLQRSKSVDTQEGVWALLSLGASWGRTGLIDRAQTAYRRALKLATELDLPRLRGRALTGLGMVAWARKDRDGAVEHFSNAADIFNHVEDLTERARVLNNLGLIRREQGLYKEALTVLGMALSIKEREADPRSRSATLDEIANVLMALERLDEAGDAARRARAEARAAGDEAREAVTQVTLARILRAQDRGRQAAGLCRAAVDTLTRLGMAREAAFAAAELGMMLKEAGRSAEAAHYLARALALTGSHPTESTGQAMLVQGREDGEVHPMPVGLDAGEGPLLNQRR